MGPVNLDTSFGEADIVQETQPSNNEYVRSIRKRWSFKLSAQEWKSIAPKSSASKRSEFRLRYPWTQIFSKKFKETNSECSLRFSYNHICKEHGRKRHTPYFVGKAKCGMSGCLTYIFKIRKLPGKDKRVKVRVSVFGEEEDPQIRHQRYEKKARNISGEERQLMASKIKNDNPSNVYYKELGDLSTEAFEAGNRDHVGNKSVLHKISSEMNKAERLHDDILKECIIARAIYIEDDKESKVVTGFIQHVSAFPFCLHMYTEKQLRILIKKIQTGNAYLHFDATGTIIGKIPDHDKSVFYYPLILSSSVSGQPAIPIAEMLSNRHSTAEISNFFFKLKKSLHTLKPGVCSPQKVELDFSWAMIHGVILGFNQESIVAYLTRQWKNIKKKDFSQETKSIVHLCCAHIIHSFSRKLHSLTKDKGLIEIILYSFGIMQNATSLDYLVEVFSNICTICLSRQGNNLLTNSLDQIHANLRGQEEKEELNSKVYENQNEDGRSEEDAEEEPEVLKDTPFAKHFREIRDTLKNQLGKNGQVENEYYLPEIIDYLVSTLMPLAPMWTGLCLKEKSRDTNAEIENWMKIVKKDILQGKTRLRPGAFIRKMHGTLGGRLREFQEYVENEVHANKDGLFDAKESWEKKRKANVKSHQEGKYYKRPAEIPTPKRKKVPSVQNGKRKLNNVKGSYISQGDNTKQKEDHLISEKLSTTKIRSDKLMKKAEKERNSSEDDHVSRIRRKALPWGGQITYKNSSVCLVNTCPIDNLLYLIHLVVIHNPNVQAWLISNSERMQICEVLLTISNLFEQQQWLEGKAVWLNTFETFQKKNKVWDVWGGEGEKFVLHFGAIQRTEMGSRCSLPTCSKRPKTYISEEILLG